MAKTSNAAPHRIHIPLSHADLKLLKAAADDASTNLTHYIRMTAVDAAKDRLRIPKPEIDLRTHKQKEADRLRQQPAETNEEYAARIVADMMDAQRANGLVTPVITPEPDSSTFDPDDLTPEERAEYEADMDALDAEWEVEKAKHPEWNEPDEPIVSVQQRKPPIRG